jgi:SAM-dependent methyltransferase
MSSSEFDAKKYWEGRLTDLYDLHGVGFIGISRSYNAWLYRIRRFVFLRTLRRTALDTGNARVLDVGSGTGFYVQLWRDAGAVSIEGVDITEVAVGMLSKRFPDVPFRRLDISSRDAAEQLRGGFDAVSAMDVLFHVVDNTGFERAINNISGLLRPGGLLILSDNFLRGAEKRRRHIVHRRLADVAEVLERSGFEIIDRRPTFYIMNQPIDSRSRALKWLWSFVRRIASYNEVGGAVVGALLYPVELALVSIAREGPSTETMVCRKRTC